VALLSCFAFVFALLTFVFVFARGARSGLLFALLYYYFVLTKGCLARRFLACFVASATTSPEKKGTLPRMAGILFSFTFFFVFHRVCALAKILFPFSAVASTF